MPPAICPFPKNAPDTLTAHMLHLGDRLLDLLAGTIENRTHQEQLNRLVREPLPLAHLVTQV
jgi:hypothetical protein